mgnify:CR=1 FL=1
MTPLFLWLMACGDSVPNDAEGGDVPSTTSPTPTATDGEVTPPRPLSTVGPAELANASVQRLPPSLAGVAVLCDPEQADAPDRAWVAAEYAGRPDGLSATPWVDGAAGVRVELDLDVPGDVFRMTEAEATVPRCAEATWVWRIDAADPAHDRCFVRGADADAVIAALAPEACQRG